VRYRALRENLGTISVREDDGLGAETFVKPVEVLTPTTVKLFDQPCDPLTFLPGQDFKLYFQLLNGARVLADMGPDSFAVEGGATLEGSQSALWVKTKAAAGVGRITSRIDPTLSVRFTVFTPLVLRPQRGRHRGVRRGRRGLDGQRRRRRGDRHRRGAVLTDGASVGRGPGLDGAGSHHPPGLAACQDTIVRAFGTETPDVCVIAAGAQTATVFNDGTHNVTIQARRPARVG
jgi:hypothetical protein